MPSKYDDIRRTIKISSEIDEQTIKKCSSELDSFYNRYRNISMKVDTSDFNKAMDAAKSLQKVLADTKKNSPDMSGAIAKMEGDLQGLANHFKSATAYFTDGSVASGFDEILKKMTEGASTRIVDLGERLSWLKEQSVSLVESLQNLGGLRKSWNNKNVYNYQDIDIDSLDNVIQKMHELASVQDELDAFNGTPMQTKDFASSHTTGDILGNIEAIKKALAELRSLNDEKGLSIRNINSLNKRNSIINDANNMATGYDSDSISYIASNANEDKQYYNASLKNLQDYIDSRKALLEQLSDNGNLFTSDEFFTYQQQVEDSLSTATEQLHQLQGANVGGGGISGDFSQLVNILREIKQALAPLTDALSNTETAFGRMAQEGATSLDTVLIKLKEIAEITDSINAKNFNITNVTQTGSGDNIQQLQDRMAATRETFDHLQSLYNQATNTLSLLAGSGQIKVVAEAAKTLQELDLSKISKSLSSADSEMKLANISAELQSFIDKLIQINELSNKYNLGAWSDTFVSKYNFMPAPIVSSPKQDTDILDNNNTNASNISTTAFQGEAGVVEQVATAEAHSLYKVESAIDSICKAIGRKNAGFIKEGEIVAQVVTNEINAFNNLQAQIQKVLQSIQTDIKINVTPIVNNTSVGAISPSGTINGESPSVNTPVQPGGIGKRVVMHDAGGNPVSMSETTKSKTPKAIKTATEFFGFDDDGLPVLNGDKVTYDFDKFLAEQKSERQKIDGARAKIQEFLSQLDNKTLNQSKNFSGYADLENLMNSSTFNLDSIEEAKNKMLGLSSTYNTLVKEFRRGSSSLNPFVNAINNTNKLDNQIQNIEIDFKAIKTPSQELSDKVKSLGADFKNALSLKNAGDINGYAKAYGDLREKIVSVVNEITRLRKEQGITQKSRIFTENKRNARESTSQQVKEWSRAPYISKELQKNSTDLQSELVHVQDQDELNVWQKKWEGLRIQIIATQKEQDKMNKATERLTSLYEKLGKLEKQKELASTYGGKKAGLDQQIAIAQDDISQEEQRIKGELGVSLTQQQIDQAKQRGMAIEEASQATIAGARADSKAGKEEAKTVEVLTKLYKQLGEQKAIATTMTGAKKDKALSNMGSIVDNINAIGARGRIDHQTAQSIVDSQYNETIRGMSNDAGVKDEKAWKSQQNSRLTEIGNLYSKIGKLRAKIGDEGNAAEDAEIIRLRAKIEELKKEYDLYNLIDQKKMDTIESDAYSSTSNNGNRAQSIRDQKAALREQIKRDKEENQYSTANSALNFGRNVQMSLSGLNISNDNIAEIESVQKLALALQNLKNIKNSIDDKISKKKSGMLSPEEEAELQKELSFLQTYTASVKKYSTEVQDLINNTTKLSGDNVSVMPGQYTQGQDVFKQLSQSVMEFTNGRAVIRGFNNDTQELIYEVKTGHNEVTQYAAAWRKVDGALVSVPGKMKKVEGFLESVKRKTGEIMRYFTGMSIISRVIREIRQGITYVKEIDSALTELKKVTDETEETYDRFLNTASKTATKVGSTIKDIVSSTADFARLGYSLNEAAELATSAQVLLNTSEFTDVSRATDTLISSIKAFGYAADQSMDVVDLLNEIGK